MNQWLLYNFKFSNQLINYYYQRKNMVKLKRNVELEADQLTHANGRNEQAN